MFAEIFRNAPRESLNITTSSESRRSNRLCNAHWMAPGSVVADDVWTNVTSSLMIKRSDGCHQRGIIPGVDRDIGDQVQLIGERVVNLGASKRPQNSV